MPTPLGVSTITSIVDRHLMPQIVDNFYSSNFFFYRLSKANKKLVNPGTQIEVPVMLRGFDAGGFYQGLETLTMAPADTIRTAAWQMKQAYVPLVFSGRDLMVADSPDAIVNLMTIQSEQAGMEMAEILATSLFSVTSDPKGLDSVVSAVDDGTNAGTYGGLSRTTWTNWKASRDSSNASLSITQLNAAFINAQQGGRTPSVIVSGTDAYAAYYNLAYGSAALTQHTVSTGTMDNATFAAGFQNVLFNGIPWVADSHVQADPAETGASESRKAIFMLNEEFWDLVVSPRGDMVMEPFQTPIGQDAIATKLLWYGNVICRSPRTNAVIARWN